MWLGDYIETPEYAQYDPTLTGVGGQLGMGLLGLDLPLDIRDLTYSFTHWEWTWGHVGITALNLLAFIPVVGMVKHGDEVARVLRSADEAGNLGSAARRGLSVAGSDTSLLTALGASTDLWNPPTFPEWLGRGRRVEEHLGVHPDFAPNNPVIDNFVDGIAISIKSRDLRHFYQNVGNLIEITRTDIRALSSYKGQSWGNISIDIDEVQSRELWVAVPPLPDVTTLGGQQLDALQGLQHWAVTEGVDLRILTPYVKPGG